jgi:hypothetical protein
MIRQPQTFLSMLRAIEAMGHPLEGGELRKRLPRGFESASSTAVAPYLLWNSFISRREMPDHELQSPELPRRILALAQASRPLLDYGWALMPGRSASAGVTPIHATRSQSAGGPRAGNEARFTPKAIICPRGLAQPERFANLMLG